VRNCDIVAQFVLVLVLSEAVLVIDWGEETAPVDSITSTSTVASD
jgi:hypothetical protein